MSAIAALFVGSWLTRALIALPSTRAEDLSLAATPDLRVLTFTLAVTTLTAVLFGLLPAWQNSHVAPIATLREAAGAITRGRTHVRMRKIFVGLQVGLAAVLLLGAGLFIRSLDNLRRVDLGLPSSNVVTFLARPAVPYDDARKVQAYGTLIQSQLFDVNTDDPLVFAIAVATLLSAAGTATLIPALRASRMSRVWPCDLSRPVTRSLRLSRLRVESRGSREKGDPCEQPAFGFWWRWRRARCACKRSG